MKNSYFQAVVVSILLYGCTTWTVTKHMEKKLDENFTRMLQAILNNSWRQYPTKQHLYGHLPPITKTIKITRTKHCWRSRDELISDVLLWTLLHGRAKAGRPARTYIQQLSADTGCSPEERPEAMDDREGWRERVKDIRADNLTWWWWHVLPKFTVKRYNEEVNKNVKLTTTANTTSVVIITVIDVVVTKSGKFPSDQWS